MNMNDSALSAFDAANISKTVQGYTQDCASCGFICNTITLCLQHIPQELSGLITAICSDN